MQLNEESSKLVVIQMTVPYWYQADIIRYLQSKTSRKPFVVAGSSACRDTLTALLFGDEGLRGQYYSLDSDLNALSADNSRKTALTIQIKS